VEEDLRRLSAAGRVAFHAAVFVLVCGLAVPCFTRAQPQTLLDYANLPFHEAGHYILMPFFGHFIVSLGGTVGQLFVPSAFAVYFGLRRDWFPMAACVFWLGQNLVNVSVYMHDAKVMLLPLFGGGEDGEGHDWNYLFGQMKLLHESTAIADRVRLLAAVVMSAGLAGMLLALIREAREAHR
jgi:hypothetical protein